jgi:hypothetical protein
MTGRVAWLAALLMVSVAAPVRGQTRAAAPRVAPKAASANPLIKAGAAVVCPSILGTGIATKEVFCDVMTGRDPAAGIVVMVPPHRGPATLTFDLHNRHTFSEALVKEKRAYTHYTATIGVLTLDNTLLTRAVVDSEFRTAGDLVDRIGGGAGPGGVKAVAPTGSEPIAVEIPSEVDAVSLLGEKLTMIKVDGTETFTAPDRPIATVSNVVIEYRPLPKPVAKPARATKRH